MAQRFIAWDVEQSFLMPTDVRDWLPEDHFAWFVLGAVEAMDLEAFYGAYRADGRSRPAFEPAMMVALILYSYARGIRSSRAIERVRRGHRLGLLCAQLSEELFVHAPLGLFDALRTVARIGAACSARWSSSQRVASLNQC
jgi:hypothetical protein